MKFLIVLLLCLIEPCWLFASVDRAKLKNAALEMFLHAYDAYMDNAFPADELMPLSCKGRYRGQETNRGDIDDALGNYSLTLIDSLDTLVVMGQYEEFEHAVELVIEFVHFDYDVDISVFEANIRVVGGLISAHLLAKLVQSKLNQMQWYTSELLDMAKDLAYRLLPAFNTTTGMPHPRVNLRYGLTEGLKQHDTSCTACGGTMILEFAALSRLTGEPAFEERAKKAMDFLWQQRHRGSDLMGNVLNVNSGDWVRRDSGIGAGIDSYYEYCLKAYILLGEETYLDRFNKHYAAVMNYVKQGLLMVSVQMHKPQLSSRSYMDALLAFWPGLQVLKGDLKQAIEMHEMLYQVVQRHKFLPEAFTHDFQVHWGQHPLRPEFLESTYFLYRATKDTHYLEVGQQVLESLNKHARVPCGFAAVSDVRTMAHEDRMDSFVLAETFKYLYLLFAEEDELLLDPDNYVFTTEAHFLPLNLAPQPGREKAPNIVVDLENDDEPYFEQDDRSCPNIRRMTKDNVPAFAQVVRDRVGDLIGRIHPKAEKIKLLTASEFNAGNADHMRLIKRMGIHLVTMPDGRIQLVHIANKADSIEDAEQGYKFMQEMIALSQSTQESASPTYRVVQVMSAPYLGMMVLSASAALFGADLDGDVAGIGGSVATASPLRACVSLDNPDQIRGKIVLVERSDCMFVDKARNVQMAGGLGVVVIDSDKTSTASSSSVFAMSGDGSTDVHIPAVFLSYQEGTVLRNILSEYPHTKIRLGEKTLNPATWAKRVLMQPKLFFSTRQLDEPQGGNVHDSYADKSLNSESSGSTFEDGDYICERKGWTATCTAKVEAIPASRTDATHGSVVSSVDIGAGNVLEVLPMPGGAHQLRLNLRTGSVEPGSSDAEKEAVAGQLLSTLLAATDLQNLPGFEENLRALKKLVYVSLGDHVPLDSADMTLLGSLANLLQVKFVSVPPTGHSQCAISSSAKAVPVEKSETVSGRVGLYALGEELGLVGLKDCEPLKFRKLLTWYRRRRFS